jgi:hypothetical protein
MGRDMKDIRGRALKRTSKSAVGRALFKAKGGTVKKQVGGLAAPVGGATPPVGGATPPVGGAAPRVGGAPQGYNARLDESLGARNPGATGSMAGRRAMSQGMERSMGRGAYSGAGTMAKHGGTIKKKAKHGGAIKKKKK